MRTSRFVRGIAGAAVLVLTLAACGGGEEDSEAGTPGGDSSVVPEEPDVWPLTGLPADDTAALDRPVLVVKYDNTDSSAPQLGLGSADLVVEELVEGNRTRLAAFFYSRLPEAVGPVRSVRTSDVGIVAPVGAEIVTSGGAPIPIDALRGAGITFHQEGAAGFYRERGRSAPYNLMANLRETGAATEDDTVEAPPAYLAWGDAADLPEGEPATTISVDFGGRVTEWEFRDGGYHNTNSFAAADDRFVADTVLALKVPIGDAGYLDPSRNFVPETEFEGEGEGVLFHGGEAIAVTWHKDGADGRLGLTTADGDLAVPAGRTWLELIPGDTAGGQISAGAISHQP